MKTKKLKITISKKDLLTADYTEPTDCPIARAIIRAGGKLPSISCGLFDFSYKKTTYHLTNDQVRTLSSKVSDMMHGRLIPKRFSFTLNL